MRAICRVMMVIASGGVIALMVSVASGATRPTKVSAESFPVPASTSTVIGAQTSCPIIFPAAPVTVAPNQPAVQPRSTVGIINALCEVTLNFIGCGFTPTSITLGCDTDADGVSELTIPLKNISVINSLLLQATLPVLTTTPGTAFPLACCGGVATITLTRTVGAGDDNVFGPFTQTLTCPIDLGIRAPVVISAVPSDGDCAVGQNLLIPGSCFLLADGTPNVTSVFGVEAGNPNNVIQPSAIQIMAPHLIDAFFQFGAANAGKTFLIYASGPNGTSRNLTSLPSGAPAGCPLGNEQGVTVTFTCRSTGSGGSGSGEGSGPAPTVVVSGCRVERDEAGSFSLSIFGKGIRKGAIVSIGGVTPKKLKYKDLDPSDNTFTRLTAKGRFCRGLPGAIVVTNPDGTQSAPVLCGERCLD